MPAVLAQRQSAAMPPIDAARARARAAPVLQTTRRLRQKPRMRSPIGAALRQAVSPAPTRRRWQRTAGSDTLRSGREATGSPRAAQRRRLSPTRPIAPPGATAESDLEPLAQLK